jgi:hypothetical protein
MDGIAGSPLKDPVENHPGAYLASLEWPVHNDVSSVVERNMPESFAFCCRPSWDAGDRRRVANGHPRVAGSVVFNMESRI